MKKNELIEEYLFAISLRALYIYLRRTYIRNNNFICAINAQLEALCLQEEICELSDKLIYKGWYEDALKEISLC
jgi:hypothetical protein